MPPAEFLLCVLVAAAKFVRGRFIGWPQRRLLDRVIRAASLGVVRSSNTGTVHELSVPQCATPAKPCSRPAIRSGVSVVTRTPSISQTTSAQRLSLSKMRLAAGLALQASYPGLGLREEGEGSLARLEQRQGAFRGGGRQRAARHYRHQRAPVLRRAQSVSICSSVRAVPA